MTRIPVEAIGPELLPGPSPIVGSVDEILQVGSYIQRAIDASFDYRGGVQGAERSLASGRGAAITRLQAKLSLQIMPGVGILDASATAAKVGFDGYAQEIHRIHSDARSLIREVEGQLSTIRAQACVISEIADVIGASVPADWKTVPPGVMPEPRLGSRAIGLDTDERELRRRQLSQLYSMQWLSAALLWKRACEEIETARTKWARLVRERRDAEGRLVGSLRATDLGRLIAAGNSGRYSPKEMIAFGLSGELRGADLIDHRTQNAGVDALLDNRDLSGARLADAWNRLGLSRGEVSQLPMETLARLARCNGLPAWVQDVAATEVLHYSLVAPDEAYELFEFGTDGPGIDEFRSQLLRLHGAWQEAKFAARRLGGSPTVQLLALGSHDGALTAAISHGDLDTASHVGVNVSGMLSNVGDIGQDAKGARSLFHEAYQVNRRQTYASVTWIGYRSPGFGDVNLADRAKAGGTELAAFIDGVFDSRSASGSPIENFTVFAHSYGSTTAAIALEQIRHRVNSFVTYGSAGFVQNTIDLIRAEGIFSTHALGDQTADFGKMLEHPNDPRFLAGVRGFSAKGEDGYLRVTAHDMFTEHDAASPLNWGGKVGYLTTGTRSARSMGKIWATGGL